MTVAIIDYGSGNLRSCAKAFEKAGAGVLVTARPQQLAEASHIVLPGVGAFGDCMRGLSALPGMAETMCEQVLQRGKPFLGICVGMQLLFERGFEHGEHAGLGWLKGEVAPLERKGGLKIPHMGWNALQLRAPQHPLFAGVESGEHVYFVHSYHARCAEADTVLATVAYGQSIAAVVGRDNILGVQFHPEKSQAAGLRLISNFLRMA